MRLYEHGKGVLLVLQNNYQENTRKYKTSQPVHIVDKSVVFCH